MENEIKSPEDLIVYQKAYKFGFEVIKICRIFPKNDEARILKSQLIRSATSIAANIAEGYGGNKKGTSYKNYLIIARRSATESQTWMKFCLDCQFINNKNFNILTNNCKEIITILTAIIRKLK